MTRDAHKPSRPHADDSTVDQSHHTITHSVLVNQVKTKDSLCFRNREIFLFLSLRLFHTFTPLVVTQCCWMFVCTANNKRKKWNHVCIYWPVCGPDRVHDTQMPISNARTFAKYSESDRCLSSSPPPRTLTPLRHPPWHKSFPDWHPSDLNDRKGNLWKSH